MAAKSGKKLYRVDPRHTSAIERASRGGFLSGFPGLKFGPNQNLTKSEAIVSLVNGWELKAGNPDSLKVYSDRSVISTPLASSGVKSNQQSILNYPSVFRPLLQQSTVNNNSGATGIDMIPNFAVSAIATASDLNIVVNYPARDRRSPLRHITRAEISALIYQTLVAINPAKAIDSPYSGSIAW